MTDKKILDEILERAENIKVFCLRIKVWQRKAEADDLWPKWYARMYRQENHIKNVIMPRLQELTALLR